MTSPDREAVLIVTDLITQFCPHRERKSRYAVDHSARKHRCRICLLEALTRTRQQGRREGWEGALDVHVQRCTGCDVRSDRFCTEGKLYHHLAHQEEAP